MARLWAACVTHRRVPVALLERFPRGDQTRDVLGGVTDLEGVGGALVLSTCNRHEVYLTADDRLSRPVLVDLLARSAGVEPGLIEAGMDVYAGDDAVRHLFTVAAGLDSRALGEDEILGQLRAAARSAADEGSLDIELAGLVQWAVRAGRRARRAGDGPGGRRTRTSVGDEGVRLLDGRLGGLRSRSVLVLGAGRVAARVVRALASQGGRVLVVARDPASAASRFPSHAVAGLDRTADLLDEVDAVVCATSAPTAILDRSALVTAMEHRGGRPLVILDLAVPRNVEPVPGGVAGLTVLDLDALPGPGRRVSGFHAAQETVAAETAAYLEARAVRQAAELLASVSARAEEVRRAELARVDGRTSDTERALLEEVTSRLVGKLLHPALAGIRELASGGELTTARRTAGMLDGSTLDNTERPRIAG